MEVIYMHIRIFSVTENGLAFPTTCILPNIYEGWNFNSGNYLFTTDTK